VPRLLVARNLRAQVQAIEVLLSNWRVVVQDIVRYSIFSDIPPGHVATLELLPALDELLIQARGCQVGNARHWPHSFHLPSGWRQGRLLIGLVLLKVHHFSRFRSWFFRHLVHEPHLFHRVPLHDVVWDAGLNRCLVRGFTVSQASNVRVRVDPAQVFLSS